MPLPTFGLWRNRDSSTSTITPCPPSTIGGSRSSRVVQTSASSMQSVTGYCFAHRYMMSIHLLRDRRDLEKKLDSLIDYVLLQVGQNQHIPSDISLLFLSRIATLQLDVIMRGMHLIYTMCLPGASFGCCKQTTMPQECNDGLFTTKNDWPSLHQRHLLTYSSNFALPA